MATSPATAAPEQPQGNQPARHRDSRRQPLHRLTACGQKSQGLTCVLDGREGFEVASSGDFDLCLLNLALPGMDGYSIAERLQADGVDVPLVFYTGIPEHEVKAKLHSLGIKAAHIQKPPSNSGMVEKIEVVLGGRGWI